MGRYKYLLKNIGLLTISSFVTKILSFFLVPLYTNILTTAEFGSYDLFTTTIGLLVPILTCNIMDGVLRFAIDEDKDKCAIATIAIRLCVYGSVILILIVTVNQYYKWVKVISDYHLFFISMFIVTASSVVISAYARGSDHIKQLTVSSIIASAITIFLNIFFLVFLKWGIKGYFWANIVGPLAQVLYLYFATGMAQKVRVLHPFPKMRNAMLMYSLPLIVNTISWWINSASDRYVIICFCGITVNGVYAVASKIPSILNIFQTIFNQAWTLSAVKDYDPEDSNGFFRKTYCAYNCMLVIICSIIILTDKILSKMLYQKDFYQAWEYVPFLTIAIVFGALSGYLGGLLAAVRDSKSFAMSTLIGASINLLLNFILTPIIGALGAAIATAVSYLFVWISRIIKVKVHIKLQLHLTRDIVSYVVLFVQSFLLIYIKNSTLTYICQLISLFMILAMYHSDCLYAYSRIKDKVKR